MWSQCSPDDNRSRPGYTLLEVAIAISIFSMIVLAAGTLQQNIFSMSRIITGHVDLQREGRNTISGVVDQLRTASPSSLGAYPITTAQADALTFYSDVDGNGIKERYRYFMSGTTLRKGVLVPTGSPLTYNPANEVVTDAVHWVINGATPIFEYFDATYIGSGSALVQPVTVTVVRAIRITIIIDRSAGSSPTPMTFTSTVMLRNLKDNL